jgi:hypothetical protein
MGVIKDSRYDHGECVADVAERITGNRYSKGAADDNVNRRFVYKGTQAAP